MERAGQARVERRLAAILAADVAGYSRLIEADEEGTLGRLRVLRAETRLVNCGNGICRRGNSGVKPRACWLRGG